jgi:hypothetical protein
LQPRLAAIQRYAMSIRPFVPVHSTDLANGRAHQTSLATPSTASAPLSCVPPLERNLISFNNSSRESPSNAPTRASCNGASANPRRARAGASHRAIRVQNAHSASKNSQPRARLSFRSVNSSASVIIVLPFSPPLRFVSADRGLWSLIFGLRSIQPSCYHSPGWSPLCPAALPLP